MKKHRLMAVLGAAVLTFGIANVAFANTLSEDHFNQTGKALDLLISQEGVVELCDDFADLGILPGEGEVGLHFILTQPEAASGNISGSVDGTAFGPVANTVHGGGDGAMHFYVVVPGDGDSVINDAETDIDGGQLTLSHICFGAEASQPPSEGPSFSLDTGGETDAPSEPSTDAFGTSRTSGPADGAWLLVVALGVLLASVVVLTPARAKSRR